MIRYRQLAVGGMDAKSTEVNYGWERELTVYATGGLLLPLRFSCRLRQCAFGLMLSGRGRGASEG